MEARGCRCKAGSGHVFHRDALDGVDEEHLSAAQGGAVVVRGRDCEHGYNGAPMGYTAGDRLSGDRPGISLERHEICRGSTPSPTRLQAARME